jgi:ribonuclease HI
MPKTSSKFYAVARGRCPGIYNSWEECKKHTDGFKGAVFKSFNTLQEAEAYISLNNNNNTNQSESHLNSSKKRKFVDETPTESSNHDNPSISSSGSGMNPIVIEEGLKLQPRRRVKDSLQPNFLNPTKDVTTHSVKSIQPSVSSKLYTESDSRCSQTNTTKQDKDLNPTIGSNSLKVTLFFDGGSRGNPGIAGAGICIQLVKIQSMDSNWNHPSKEIITHKIRKYCGTHVTNNVAEYTGLLQGLQSLQPLIQEFLEQCKQNKKPPSVDIQIFGDSKLVVDQIKGIMKVKNENLQKLHASCMEIIRAIQKSRHIEIQFQHIYRDSNKIADGTFCCFFLATTIVVYYVFQSSIVVLVALTSCTQHLQMKP